MKRIFTFAAAALLFTGATFAQEGKKCAGKACSKKESAKKDAASKDTKSTASIKKA